MEDCREIKEDKPVGEMMMEDKKIDTQGCTPKDFEKKSLQGATKKTKFSEILEGGEDAAKILFEAGLHCVGCPMTAQESLEEGCLAHGMSEKDIDKLVERLNKGK